MRKSLSFIAFAGLCSISSLSLAATAPTASAHRAPQAPSTLVAKSNAQPRVVTSTPVMSKGAEKDQARYAAKEKSSPTAENYKGGDTVVIGATAATAILAVLLLVILL